MPMVGLSYFSPKYQAGPASWIPKAPAIAASVWAELGLAWFRRSRRQMRQAPWAFSPSRAEANTNSSAESRAGSQLAASSSLAA